MAFVSKTVLKKRLVTHVQIDVELILPRLQISASVFILSSRLKPSFIQRLPIPKQYLEPVTNK